MNEFKRLRKSERKIAVASGIVRDVAEETGFTPATVSRTLAGKFDRANPAVAEAIRRRLAALKIPATAE